VLGRATCGSEESDVRFTLRAIAMQVAGQRWQRGGIPRYHLLLLQPLPVAHSLTHRQLSLVPSWTQLPSWQLPYPAGMACAGQGNTGNVWLGERAYKSAM